MNELQAFADAPALADAVAARLAAALTAAVAARGRGALAVSGGSTPGPMFDRLAQADLAWRQVDVTLIDERFVPADHAESNARLARERLLTGRAAAARFVPLAGAAADLEAEARAAALQVAALPRPLDAVLLGMGEDGHVASLFPGSPVLAPAFAADAPDVLPVPAGDGGAAPSLPRLTLNLRRLAEAREVVLMLTGAAKRETLERAMRGVTAAAPPVRALLDAAPHAWIGWSP